MAYGVSNGNTSIRLQCNISKAAEMLFKQQSLITTYSAVRQYRQLS